jgi:hypothetical protein
MAAKTLKLCCKKLLIIETFVDGWIGFDKYMDHYMFNILYSSLSFLLAFEVLTQFTKKCIQRSSYLQNS